MKFVTACLKGVYSDVETASSAIFTSTQEEPETFLADLIRHLVHAVVDAVQPTCGSQEEECNRELIPRGTPERSARASIGDLRGEIRCKALYSAAIPCGATVKIQVLDSHSNDWGVVRICVPTR